MKAHRRAFTLVELLVVIAIIALLVALLLPALASARKAARVILCGSQLRQHGVGLNAYQVDSSGYYPLFGGPVGDVGAGRTGNVWATFQFDTNAYNAFGSYIGLSTSGITTPMTSTAPIKYCPVVDWSTYGAYSFINPAFTPYTSGLPAYSYYTGRMLFNSTIFNFNTINRRDNPRELLMTDQLMQASQDEVDFGVAISTTVTWFNPHVDRSSQVNATGSGNHLAADGHVAALPFRNRLIDPTSQCLSAYYAYAIFTGSIVGPASSLTDGPYAITP